MKLSFAPFLTTAVLALTVLSAPAADQKSVVSQKLFASPEDAIQALKNAAANEDQAAFRQIFGPDFKDLLTGDKIQDASNQKRLAAAMAQGVKPVNEGDGKITLEVGTNQWPMPIPLVQVAGKWYFDTAQGKDEIISRHIGKDELHAIGVCRAFVTAEKQFAGLNSGVYAHKFKSSPGMKDGLYWPATNGDTASPFGLLVAEAHKEGYGSSESTGLHAFHGYYFKVLTCQGPAATGGKMDYMIDGKLTGGFALVAYPEHWDKSGIMTFIVNQDGKVYKRNFAEKTTSMGKTIKAYNPDADWQIEAEEGVTGTVSEKQ